MAVVGEESATTLFRRAKHGIFFPPGDLGEIRDGRNGCISADPSATGPSAVFAAVDNSSFPGCASEPGQCTLTRVHQFLMLTRDRWHGSVGTTQRAALVGAELTVQTGTSGWSGILWD